ncbi:hypothetical protein [Ruminococcus flavefaciens]|uniref:hypothetical protein n=1 Tax=Ruminococcus flavefaciens TaxID=1265 RepID=UPI0026F0DCB2|nr:hypothetical protein [Ruminococcus flavefaciens]
MKLSELTCCPFCNEGTEYYESIYVHGAVKHYSGYDGKFNSIINTKMYDYLQNTCSGRVYCANCNKYIGNYLTDRLSKAAKNALKQKNTTNNADKL